MNPNQEKASDTIFHDVEKLVKVLEENDWHLAYGIMVAGYFASYLQALATKEFISNPKPAGTPKSSCSKSAPK